MKNFIQNNKLLSSIILVIFIIIIICLSIKLLKKLSYKFEVSNEVIDEESFDIKVDNNISKVTSRDEFFNVENCIKCYIDYINDDNYEAVKTLYDLNYIKNNNISIKDIENTNKDLANSRYIIKDMNKKEINENDVVYYCNGISANFENNKFLEINFSVLIDYEKSIFSIIPENMEENDSFEFNYNFSLDSENYYNEYINEAISYEKVLEEYFDFYKFFIINNSKLAFSLLDDEYKEKRFNNEYSNYYEYLNEINIDNVYIDKYLYEYKDDYMEYVCLDKNGYYYIIDEKNPMDFTIKLDTYTIETDKFKEQYDNSDDEKKALFNIDKWCTMLYNKDYLNAYNLLDSNFKNNNFNDINSFKEYIKNNSLTNCTWEYGTQKYIGNKTYTQDVKFSNGTDVISKTIIVKLLENRKCVISFNI